MADEVVFEKDFPCPCGRGVLRAELLEHDTWASGRKSRYTIVCEDCKPRYTLAFLLDALVLREHNDEIERRRHVIYERRRAVGDKAADRYLPQFRAHVKSLRFKTSMKEALASGYESIQSFRKRTRLEQGLDDAIEYEGQPIQCS